MSSEIAIRVENLGKVFHTYDKPRDRLVQGLLALLSRVAPAQPVKAFFRRKAEARRRDFHALHDVNFEVRKGETVGIIGRNGSGKSTLLQIICGTLTLTSGNAYFNGKVAALLELGSGFNPEFTGRDNVYLSGQLYGLSKKQIDERYEKIIEFADIGDFVAQPVKTYSSGMMVRLAFSVIAHVDAEILIIDEALAVGDVFFTQKCMRFLRQFMEDGTVLFVSHDTASVKSLCSHVIWLNKGEVVQSGTPKDVCDDYLSALLESEHGKTGTAVKALPSRKEAEVRECYDQRQQFLNSSNLRNDLQVFDFNQNSSEYGNEQASILNVEFRTTEGRRLIWIVGGEEVVLTVRAIGYRVLSKPIVGFYIKDRLGQTLFGENTYLKYQNAPIQLEPGQEFEASFHYKMPILPAGDYSVCVALADGTQSEHTQLHWIHDAIVFRSESSSVSTGLIGIPMHEMTIEKV
ncbi:ABC transporter ATP-binding protein [Pseudomonas nitroreducens]|uniref:ABC transporter ATP-binding protein n=1 Tax=Pseudomonas nitroreducens TaxID=46680 RepID=UPI0028B074C9|nr:ABC transporter ATP-binding protein [Pseudomonas nitroreducens]